MPYDCSFLDALPLDKDVVTFVKATRENHATDWGTSEGVVPDAVVYPTSTADVATVLEAANKREVPVTPYAAGTSLEGNPIPVYAGISMDLTKMDDIIDIRPSDFQIEVEPGVMGSTLADTLAREGLFFPPLPSSGGISTIGGMLANSASGMQTVKYGEVADWALELEVVLADGSVITVGSKAAKTSSGYNLRDLFVGSEGTLGVITGATLKLAGRPAQVQGGRAVFPTLGEAADAVMDTVQSGVDIAKIELLDKETAEMVNAYNGTDLPDKPLIFFEFHANHCIEKEIDFFRAILDRHNVGRFEIASSSEGMDKLWEARKDLAYAIKTFDPNLKPLHPGDVTVPISKYREIVEHVKAIGEHCDVFVHCFGHAGDGNIHYSVLVDTDDPEAVDRGETAYKKIVEQAIIVGGTATGEHGIGLGKREFMNREHGAAAVNAMRAVKNALDPKDTLNPGKVFPETIDNERVRDDNTNPM